MAGNPPLFENPNPRPPKGFEKPSLPEDYDSLSHEKIQADELHQTEDVVLFIDDIQREGQ